MGLADEAGTGILKIKKNWGKSGFIEPEIISDNRISFFKITLRFQKEDTITVEKTREKIIRLIKNNKHITISELGIEIGISEKGIEWQIKKLKKDGILRRIGSDKGGHWEIVVEKEDK